MSTLLHTETFGQGIPVVLLHGWGMNSQIWPKALLQSINAQWILVDLPGHGRSSQLPLSDDLNTVLKQLLAVIPNNALIIGWSLGGMFTLALQQYLAKQSNSNAKARGRRFGLIASSPLFIKKSHWPYATEAEILNSFSKNLASNAKQTIKRFIALQFINQRNAKPQITAIQNKILNHSVLHEPSLQVGLHYLQSLDLRADCQLLKQNVFGFFGALDNLVPIKATNKIENCFTDQQFTTIRSAKSGHAPFLSDLELFKTFLQQVINNEPTA